MWYALAVVAFLLVLAVAGILIAFRTMLVSLIECPYIKLFGETSKTVSIECIEDAYNTHMPAILCSVLVDDLWGDTIHSVDKRLWSIFTCLLKTKYGRRVLLSMLKGEYNEKYGELYLVESSLSALNGLFCKVTFERSFRPGVINTVYGIIDGSCMTTVFIDSPMNADTKTLDAGGTGFDFKDDNFKVEPLHNPDTNKGLLGEWKKACDEFDKALCEAGEWHSYTHKKPILLRYHKFPVVRWNKDFKKQNN